MFDFGIVIPARLGSSRIHEKVLQEINGKSLLEIKLDQCVKVCGPSNVWLSTESELIGEVGEKFGVNLHWRDPHYSQDHEVSFSELIDYVVSSIPVEHIFWTPCVVPFFDEKELTQSMFNYKKYVLNGDFDSLLSVVKKKEYFWDRNGPLNYRATHEHTISQNLPEWFQVTNGLYAGPKKMMLEKRYLLGDSVYLDEKPWICSVDIDEWEDLEMARALGSCLL